MRSQKITFDNSNLNESYAGVTTPLTFSFAKRAYNTVYKEFCHIMGVPEKEIKDNEPLFNSMISFICGRLYYNLLNWYRLISFIPGYSFNRGFLEKMLGVSKELYYDPRKKLNGKDKIIQSLLLLKQTVKISFEFFRLNKNVERFLKEFDKEFKKLNAIGLTSFTDQELLDFYLKYEQKFQTKWRITIVNDLATMIATGIARKMVQSWLDDKNGVSINRYLANVKNIESTRPGEKFKKILFQIQSAKNLLELFKDSSNQKICDLIFNNRKYQKIRNTINEYLSEFGDSSPGGLKLESKTYREHPQILTSLIKNQLPTLVRQKSDSQKKSFEDKEYLIEKTTKKLGLIKGLLFKITITQSRAYIKNREAARLRRSQIFGFARKVFKEFGRRLALQGFIKKKSDIFFLQVEEIIGIFNGTLIDKNIKSQIKERRKEFLTWSKIEVPGRIEITSSTYSYELKKLPEFEKAHHKKIATDWDLKGLICSVGVNGELISGEALVMKVFNPVVSFVGKILVAKQTDPGWTPIFPYLKGIVVERGGMLSHAAIVAREFGIPCISGVERATDVISTGQKLILDLKQGKIYCE